LPGNQCAPGRQRAAGGSGGSRGGHGGYGGRASRGCGTAEGRGTAFGKGSGGSDGFSSLLCCLCFVLADLLRLQNQELHSAVPTIRRTCKVCQSPFSRVVNIHCSESGLPLHSLILVGQSLWPGNKVRMLLTWPDPFELRNPILVVLVA